MQDPLRHTLHGQLLSLYRRSLEVKRCFLHTFSRGNDVIHLNIYSLRSLKLWGVGKVEKFEFCSTWNSKWVPEFPLQERSRQQVYHEEETAPLKACM